MKKFLFLLAFLIAPIFGYGESYKCPDDGCSLILARTEFCVGTRCRTVKIYQCGCCSKEWSVYQ